MKKKIQNVQTPTSFLENHFKGTDVVSGNIIGVQNGITIIVAKHKSGKTSEHRVRFNSKENRR